MLLGKCYAKDITLRLYCLRYLVGVVRVRVHWFYNKVCRTNNYFSPVVGCKAPSDIMRACLVGGGFWVSYNSSSTPYIPRIVSTAPYQCVVNIIPKVNEV